MKRHPLWIINFEQVEIAINGVVNQRLAILCKKCYRFVWKMTVLFISLSHYNQLSIMKHFFYFVIILCGVCGISSCHRSPFAEYRMEKVDSIRISYPKNRFIEYVCIKNQEKIDSLCDIIYNSTTKEVAKFLSENGYSHIWWQSTTSFWRLRWISKRRI